MTRQAGGNLSERVRYAHLNLSPPDPHKVNPRMPAELGPVVLKALAKDPKERFGSAIQFFDSACLAVGIAPERVPDKVDLPAPFFSNGSFVPGLDRLDKDISESPIGSDKLRQRFLVDVKEKVALLTGLGLVGLIVSLIVFAAIGDSNGPEPTPNGRNGQEVTVTLPTKELNGTSDSDALSIDETATQTASAIPTASVTPPPAIKFGRNSTR